MVDPFRDSETSALARAAELEDENAELAAQVEAARRRSDASPEALSLRREIAELKDATAALEEKKADVSSLQEESDRMAVFSVLLFPLVILLLVLVVAGLKLKK